MTDSAEALRQAAWAASQRAGAARTTVHELEARAASASSSLAGFAALRQLRAAYQQLDDAQAAYAAARSAFIARAGTAGTR